MQNLTELVIYRQGVLVSGCCHGVAPLMLSSCFRRLLLDNSRRAQTVAKQADAVQSEEPWSLPIMCIVTDQVRSAVSEETTNSRCHSTHNKPCCLCHESQCKKAVIDDHYAGADCMCKQQQMQEYEGVFVYQASPFQRQQGTAASLDWSCHTSDVRKSRSVRHRC